MTRVLDLPLGTPRRVRRAWRALHSFRCLRELRAAYGMQEDGALTDEARTALIRARQGGARGHRARHPAEGLQLVKGGSDGSYCRPGKRTLRTVA